MFNKKNINRVMFVLTFVGMALSAYLWYVHIYTEDVPCTSAGNCEAVIKGKWGTMFGVPLGVYGFFYYAILALLIFEREFISAKIINQLITVLLVWGVIYSVYLRYLEFEKIGSICTMCWISVFIVLFLSFGQYKFLQLSAKK